MSGFDPNDLFSQFFSGFQGSGNGQQQPFDPFQGQGPFGNFNFQGNFQQGGSTGSSNQNNRPRPDDYIPPAARSAIVNLPEVVISKKDLALNEGENCECAICLEEQKLCGIGVKMPCGHIFCKECT